MSLYAMQTAESDSGILPSVVKQHTDATASESDISPLNAETSFRWQPSPETAPQNHPFS